MKLTRKGFRAWLESFSEGGIVGKSKDCCECPMAMYLKAQGAGRPEVSAQSYWFEDPMVSDIDTSRPLPRWARLFVNDVDAAHYRAKAPVTREAALGILDKPS